MEMKLTLTVTLTNSATPSQLDLWFKDLKNVDEDHGLATRCRALRDSQRENHVGLYSV